METDGGIAASEGDDRSPNAQKQPTNGDDHLDRALFFLWWQWFCFK